MSLVDLVHDHALNLVCSDILIFRELGEAYGHELISELLKLLGFRECPPVELICNNDCLICIVDFLDIVRRPIHFNHCIHLRQVIISYEFGLRDSVLGLKARINVLNDLRQALFVMTLYNKDVLLWILFLNL